MHLRKALGVTFVMSFFGLYGYGEPNERGEPSPKSAQAEPAPSTQPTSTMTNGVSPVTRGGPGRIGLVISTSPEGAVVERVVIGGPAWQAGMRMGDVIVEVDARPLAGVPSLGVAQLLRGPVGSEVEMTVKRAGQKAPLKVKSKRTVVPPPGDVITL